MSLEAFLDSSHELAAHSMAPSGGFVQSSSSDNLLQKRGQFQAVIASLLDASSGNLSSSTPRTASSSVMDANFIFPKIPYSHRSSNTTIESNINVPTLSSSSLLNGSSIAQHTFNVPQNRSEMLKNKQVEDVFSVMTSQESQKHYNSLVIGVKQEPIDSTQRHKKPRLDIKEEALQNQYSIQQLLQSQNSMQLQRYTPQLQALFHNHMSWNQNHPKLQGVHMQPQQQPMKNQQQYLGVNSATSTALQPSDEGACSRRLMQYIFHLRHRPPDNGMAYWREFVAEYYAPCAKRRWCVSLYDKAEHQDNSFFSHAAMDGWQCEICGCRSGKGFEAVYEVLPRLSKLTFETGVIDELLFLDCPRGYRFPSGLMMLEYGKAVQESVYEQLRVVHEGQLRVVFNQDFKILSWEFCARCHEVYHPRSLVESQVNQFVNAAQKYESSIDNSGSGEVSPQDLRANRNLVQEAGFWLAKALDLQLVDDFGFSKRYTRSLQVADIANTMTDLMTFCKDNHTGPIESFKNYTTKLQAAGESGENKQLERAQDLPLNEMATSHGVGANANDISNTSNPLATGLEQAASALPGYFHKLMTQNIVTSIPSPAKQETHTPNQEPSSKSFHGPKTTYSKMAKNLLVNGLSSSLECSGQITQNCMIHKILQEMKNMRAINEDEVEVPIIARGNRC
ncbi:probable transcriptional regulator SLK2 [Ziziphus jujuba]|uniref:Transcriptional regulator SLK2 n=2 Tax=Ziziphus jujuba TaxID=326968 RepID=A0A978UGT3_ZIZJJ|nr:probable transcriptional regulator SLK2 [Ziziphus jujuba]XP_060674274.1 probable transcriptional regulator SLK2 [Ziziphus jujuba]XP_060674275.1 probable transcriptional regulator SLK2 [Ziziphus jujuba]KAH7514014.1 hypothetical protein FEM48_Zijuj11G0043700 [Ziziphus jujuba var. spinosa]